MGLKGQHITKKNSLQKNTLKTKLYITNQRPGMISANEHQPNQKPGMISGTEHQPNQKPGMISGTEH